MDSERKLSGLRRYIEQDSPFPEEIEDPPEAKAIDLGNDPKTGENIVRLVAKLPVPVEDESPWVGESIPKPRESQQLNQQAIKGAPISVVRRAIKELHTGELDERALLLIGDVDVDSPAFRRLYIEARCQSYLDSPLGRHHMPPLSLLTPPTFLQTQEAIIQPSAAHSSRISHAQMLEMARKNPWAINSLRDLFNHHGPMVTMVVGAAAAAALQLHLKVLGGAHWQLPLLLLIMMLPAALHLRSMHGRDHLEFFKPLVGYLVAYLSAFVAFYILDSFGDSVLSNMTGRLGGP